MDGGVTEVRQNTADPDTKKPTKALDQDALLERLKRWWKEDAEHCEQWHKSAREDFDFVSGRQWSDEDKAYLTEQNRPALTFNRTEVVVDAVVGAEVANRQEVRYLPRTNDDGEKVELYTEAGRWFRDQCDAEHEESLAFASTAICGMGWTETCLSYDENPDGEPKVSEVNPLEMYWDSVACKPNLTDARRIWRVRRHVPIEEARELAPGFEDEDLDASWAVEGSDSALNSDRGAYEQNSTPADGELNLRKTVTLVEAQWVEKEDYYRGVLRKPVMPSPEEMAMGAQPRIEERELKLDAADHEAILAYAEKTGAFYKAIKQKRKCYYRAFVGAEVLTPRDEQKLISPSGVPCEGFYYQCITGKRDRNKRHFYGLVRQMRDPQCFANKWLSQALHKMNTSAKGGVMMEEGAITNVREFNESWARNDAVTYVKDGALVHGRIQPKPVSNMAAFEMQMVEFAIASIRDTTGVNAEVLGLRDANQPASLEYQRRQAGTTILASLFDSLRRYRKIQGRLLLHFITEYLSDGRLIRIVGKDREQYVPLRKEPGTIEYDIIVDDAPTSPNQKEQVFAFMSQLMPVLGADGLDDDELLIWLEASPLPASIISKLKEAKAKKAQNPQPPPEVMKMQAELEMKAQAAQLDAQNKQQDMQIRREEAEMDMQAKMAEMQIDMQKAMLEIQAMKAKMGLDIMAQREANELKAESQQAALANQVAMGEIKADQTRQMGFAKVAQAQAMAKVKPKPNPKGQK